MFTAVTEIPTWFLCFLFICLVFSLPKWIGIIKRMYRMVKPRPEGSIEDMLSGYRAWRDGTASTPNPRIRTVGTVGYNPPPDGIERPTAPRPAPPRGQSGAASGPTAEFLEWARNARVAPKAAVPKKNHQLHLPGLS